MLLWTAAALLGALAGRPACLGCDYQSLARYTLRVTTFWTPHAFPKQYPVFRPPAQWSKLYGVAHDGARSLWRLGEAASGGLESFAETGSTQALLAHGEGVLDEFTAPPIAAGAGTSSTALFVDGNHTKVSVIMKIVPSPDWFVGLDSIDLCRNGHWVDSLMLKGGPIDAGTDSGFTFTAPNWKSEPKEIIRQITAKSPSHPANSFHYPDKEELPTIAVFHFEQNKLYQMQKKNKIKTSINDLAKFGRINEVSNDLPPVDGINIKKKKKNKGKEKKSHKKRIAGCKVSEWSPWGQCSLSCGIGEKRRSRTVLRHSRIGGLPCPPLVETTRCSRSRSCQLTHFRWT